MITRPPRAPGCLCIWQQNTYNSKYTQQYIINSANPANWNILVIQEPWLDPHGNTRASGFWCMLYPSSHFHDNTPCTCSILLINTNISTEAYSQLSIPSNDITAVQLKGDFSHLMIFNLYNDCMHNDTLMALSRYLESNLDSMQPSPDDVML